MLSLSSPIDFILSYMHFLVNNKKNYIELKLWLKPPTIPSFLQKKKKTLNQFVFNKKNNLKNNKKNLMSLRYSKMNTKLWPRFLKCRTIKKKYTELLIIKL